MAQLIKKHTDRRFSIREEVLAGVSITQTITWATDFSGATYIEIYSAQVRQAAGTGSSSADLKVTQVGTGTAAQPGSVYLGQSAHQKNVHFGTAGVRLYADDGNVTFTMTQVGVVDAQLIINGRWF